GGLGHFGQAEKVAVERTRGSFTADRDRDLNVVDGAEHSLNPPLIPANAGTQMQTQRVMLCALKSQTAEPYDLGPGIRRDERSKRGHHPTDPSRLMATSFCASTANSMGSSCRTSRTKPLTSNATASSSGRPRCMA